MKSPVDGEFGEDMNVRAVHGALWRELGEPFEYFRRLPWYVRHTMFTLLFLGVVYLMTQVYNWREYEENSLRRIERDEAVKLPVDQGGAP